MNLSLCILDQISATPRDPLDFHISLADGLAGDRFAR